MGKIGPAAKVTVPLLEQNLQDRDPLLRFASAWALLQVDPQRSDLATLCTEPLRWGLKYANSRLQTEAAQALGSLGPDAANAVPDLEALAKDADDIVRQEATEAATENQPSETESARFLRARAREPGQRNEIVPG